jgi:dipeptidyl aminopeptidase/acylaminoacyl peptidase
MKRLAFACAAIMALATLANAQAARGLQPEDFASLRDVGDPQIAPDGRTVAYTITRTNFEKNSRQTEIWLVPTAGGEPRRLTSGAGSSTRPRWSPDGKSIAFISTRDGAPQLYVVDASGGGEPKRLTSLHAGASDHVWAADGSALLFTSEVYPDCPDERCNKERAERAESDKVKAKVADRLLYRHWSSWKEGKRSHVFVVAASGGAPEDLTPGDYDAPPFSLGGPDNYVFSPDGKEVCFARNTDADEAASTNNDLFVVSQSGGEPKRITTGKGSDVSPLYSPDGNYIAYRSQARAGFEADKFRLMLHDRRAGTSRSLTDGLDRWVEEFVWTPDGSRIIFVTDDASYAPIYEIDVATSRVRPLVEKSSNGSLSIAADGRTIAFTRSSETKPAEVFVANADGTDAKQVTRTNDDVLARIALVEAEDLYSTGALRAKVHSLLFKPVGFDAAKKYPLIVLIHGGPQGAWHRSWGARWNPNIYAAAGYVVLMPNPRGSSGYGQKFLDEVSGDWGGKAYVDIMSAVDAASKLPYVDATRVGAAGASYGGYMVNWILGHSARFKALVSHAGVYNLTSMAGATEELWFPDWEFKGTPWTNPVMYKKWSPNEYVPRFATPTLVTHGELDYRVPVDQSLQLFTALQRKKVPSKLVVFPDEGHWILKAQNRVFWYHQVLDWLDTHLKK